MKKIVFSIVFLAIISLGSANAQIWSAQLRGQNGFATIIGSLNYSGVPLSIYKGNVVNGVANGYGTWYFINGEIFTGHFYNGWPDGAGVYFSYYGILKGCWSNGNYVGNCYQEVQSFYRKHNYGGDDDALAGVAKKAPGSYDVDANNYNIDNTTNKGKHLYGGW